MELVMEEVKAKVSEPAGIGGPMPFRRIFSTLGKTIDQASNMGGGLSATLILAIGFIVFYEIIAPPSASASPL